MFAFHQTYEVILRSLAVTATRIDAGAGATTRAHLRQLSVDLLLQLSSKVKKSCCFREFAFSTSLSIDTIVHRSQQKSRWPKIARACESASGTAVVIALPLHVQSICSDHCLRCCRQLGHTQHPVERAGWCRWILRVTSQSSINSPLSHSRRLQPLQPAIRSTSNAESEPSSTVRRAIPPSSTPRRS